MPGPTGQRAERGRKYGVDCIDALVFHNWQPGGEYRKTLVVKNVLDKVQKITFKCPSSTVFSLPFPEPITLSAGITKNIEVIFRPLVSVPANDFITFETKFGSFKIPLTAYIPICQVDMPEIIDFGFCPVDEPTILPVQLTNNGEVPASFSLSTCTPFSVRPSEGALAPGERTTVHVQILPHEATVFVGSLVASVPGQQPRTVRISGIGKFPHIAVARISNTASAALEAARQQDATVVDFGEVPAGTTATRTVVLCNASTVRATFNVDAEGEHCGAFAVRPLSGVIPAEGEFTLTVTFNPAASGSFTADAFKCLLPSGSSLRLRCAGTAGAAEVLCNKNYLNFGDLRAGASTARAIHLTNNANLPVSWMANSASGIFTVTPPQGVLAARSTVAVSIAFNAVLPINYHKRLFILLSDRPPIRLDLLGTGFDDVHRPMPFDLEHVLRSNQWQDDSYDEFFENDSSDDALYRITPAVVSLEGSTSARDIIITNTSETKVTTCWTPPEQFRVEPASCDIAPGAAARFSLSFAVPPRGGTYVGGPLEAFVFNKAQRSFRLVDDESFFAPRCVSTIAVASSFALGAEQFVPSAVCEPNKISFPPSAPSGFTFATAVLTNNADTPLRYSCSFPDGESAFAVQPAGGVVPARSFQVLILRFQPPSERGWSSTMRIMLNGGAVDPLTLSLSGDAAAPNVVLDNDGMVYFKPTGVGTTSSRSLTIRNIARVDAAYRWEIPSSLQSSITISPPEGVLRGGDAATALFSFGPKIPRSISSKIPLIVRPVGSGTGSERRQAVALVRGESTGGVIVMEPEVISFGSVLVGTAGARTITVRNLAQCNMAFATTTAAVVNDDGTDTASVTDSDEPVLEIVPARGIVPALGTVTVQAILRTSKLCKCKFKISLYVEAGPTDVSAPDIQRPPTDASLATLGGETPLPTAAVEKARMARLLPSQHVMDITAYGEGAIPVLSVVDVQSQSFSRSRAWTMTWADELNRELAAEMSSTELELLQAHKFDNRRAQLEQQLACVPINFSAAPLDSDVTELQMMFGNRSELGVEFAIAIPGDDDDAVERWAAPSQPTRDELERAAIVDENIFTVQPRSAKLAPGQNIAVTLRYKHTALGTHRLPIMLRVRHGKQLILALFGRTIPVSEPFLYFNSNHHYLRPVAVGTARPPLQHMQIYNDGAVPAQFSLDLSAIESLTEDSQGVPIFRCGVTSGTVQPGGSVSLPWVFAPLETREYVLAVPVNVLGAPASTVIAVHGIGYANDEIAEDDIPIPPVQPLLKQSGLVVLAADVVDLGVVATNTLARGLVVMRNTSKQEVAFAWKECETNPTGVVLRPKSGVIAAGGCAECRVEVLCSQPIAVDDDIICTLTPASEPVAAPSPVQEEVLARDYKVLSPTKPLGSSFRQSVVGRHTASSARQLGLTDHLEQTRTPGGTIRPRATVAAKNSSKLTLHVRALVMDMAVPANAFTPLTTPSVVVRPVRSAAATVQQLTEALLAAAAHEAVAEAFDPKFDKLESPLFVQTRDAVNHPLSSINEPDLATQQRSRRLAQMTAAARSPSVARLVESLMEGVLFSLMGEATAKEFDVTTPLLPVYKQE